MDLKCSLAVYVKGVISFSKLCKLKILNSGFRAAASLRDDGASCGLKVKGAGRPESPRERRIAVPCCLEMESAVRARGGPPAYRGGVFGHRRLQGGAEGRGELGEGAQHRGRSRDLGQCFARQVRTRKASSCWLEQVWTSNSVVDPLSKDSSARAPPALSRRGESQG